MDIILHNHSSVPLYKQLYTQIVQAIAAGQLRAGDSLPSIRTLARDLGIGIITVKTAYEQLEQDGYLRVQPAKGCFVHNNAPALANNSLQELETATLAFVQYCKQKGYTRQEIADKIDKLYDN